MQAFLIFKANLLIIVKSHWKINYGKSRRKHSMFNINIKTTILSSLPYARVTYLLSNQHNKFTVDWKLMCYTNLQLVLQKWKWEFRLSATNHSISSTIFTLTLKAKFVELTMIWIIVSANEYLICLFTLLQGKLHQILMKCVSFRNFLDAWKK